ncbi:MAG: hypothetical protein KAT34_17315 [Candidatus Aminicenantes bacterium]|nr:hypothetical protein [Candidatus Aminicenantes bacterium]
MKKKDILLNSFFLRFCHEGKWKTGVLGFTYFLKTIFTTGRINYLPGVKND